MGFSLLSVLEYPMHMTTQGKQNTAWILRKAVLAIVVEKKNDFPNKHFSETQSYLVFLLHRDSLRQSTHLLECQEQGLSSQLTISLSLDSHVQLMGHSKSRKGKVHSLGLVQSNAHILDEMFHEETRVEVSHNHAGSQVVDTPGSGSSGTHGSNGFIQIKTCLVSIDQTLAHTNLHCKSSTLGVITMLVAIKI